MKNKCILIIIMALSLLTTLSSCSVYYFGFPPNTQNASPEILEYVKKHFYNCGQITRWNDGYIDVYDETNYKRIPDVLQVWNEVIGGSTIFQLSENPNSPVHILNQNGVFYEGEEVCALTIDQNCINGWNRETKVIINSNPNLLYNKFNVYLHEFGHVIGFDNHTIGDNDIMGYTASTCVIPEIMVAAVRYVYGVKIDYNMEFTTANSPNLEIIAASGLP
ncbi:MAG TPA: hypothetical protein GX009_09795 [Candidatus Atribacteria bacterium]|jgi:hypothetical protein|uniref:Peptidase metallopeptidase domain-containing protein n=1 Tax=Atribacter laminatus TaxID=2847778 RepID=A0A7T1F2W3_ATRLM|nr:hypothetical protein [Atribacter laminatus]QPM68177.1 hypothetical protein RT761_01391 [Atribacter laminatus]HHT10592.1 hypothetical protein [Candidatus Atribacteria bacterium]